MTFGSNISLPDGSHHDLMSISLNITRKTIYQGKISSKSPRYCPSHTKHLSTLVDDFVHHFHSYFSIILFNSWMYGWTNSTILGGCFQGSLFKLWLDSIIQIELGIERPTSWLIKHIGITDWCRSQLRGLNSYHQHMLSRVFICALGVHYLCGNKVCAWLFPENTCFTKENFIFYISKIFISFFFF